MSEMGAGEEAREVSGVDRAVKVMDGDGTPGSAIFNSGEAAEADLYKDSDDLDSLISNDDSSTYSDSLISSDDSSTYSDPIRTQPEAEPESTPPQK